MKTSDAQIIHDNITQWNMRKQQWLVEYIKMKKKSRKENTHILQLLNNLVYPQEINVYIKNCIRINMWAVIKPNI